MTRNLERACLEMTSKMTKKRLETQILFSLRSPQTSNLTMMSTALRVEIEATVSNQMGSLAPIVEVLLRIHMLVALQEVDTLHHQRKCLIYPLTLRVKIANISDNERKRKQKETCHT